MLIFGYSQAIRTHRFEAMGVGEVLGLGFAGGLAPEALKWFRLREELHKEIPGYATKWPYWVTTFIMVLFGALLAWIYHLSNDVQLNAL